jgi:hypothetical protein
VVYSKISPAKGNRVEETIRVDTNLKVTDLEIGSDFLILTLDDRLKGVFELPQFLMLELTESDFSELTPRDEFQF